MEAKEKKAKAGGLSPKFGTDPEPSTMHADQCKLCDFKYTHKYSIQDHIFTKSHIDNAKKHLKAELDREQEQTAMLPVAPPAAHGADANRHTPRSEQSENHLPEVNMATHPHLAQLQAMGLQAMGLPPNAGENLLNYFYSMSQTIFFILIENLHAYYVKKTLLFLKIFYKLAIILAKKRDRDRRIDC